MKYEKLVIEVVQLEEASFKMPEEDTEGQDEIAICEERDDKADNFDPNQF